MAHRRELPDGFNDFNPAEGTGYIYKISRRCDNGQEKGYIGKSQRPFRKRILEHLYWHEGCRYIHAALNKYGRNGFSYHILEQDILIEDLPAREHALVALHNTYRCGYNLTEGGVANPMNNPDTRARHKKIMGSREFIEKSAIKRNKTFQTKEYKERTSETRIEQWKHANREKHSNSLKEAWKKDRERRVASLQGLWDDESRRKLQLEGMRIHFAMKKDPNVTPEEFAEFKAQRAREVSKRARERKRERERGGNGLRAMKDRKTFIHGAPAACSRAPQSASSPTC